MKKIEKNKAASWCCEASTTVDIRKMIEAIKKESSDKTKENKTFFRMKKIEKNKAASWCCEASTTVDIRKMIEAIKKESSDNKK